MRVAHLALDLGLRDERCHGVDCDDVERPRANEKLRDLERLLPGVRLRDEELVDVHPDPPCVARVHRVLGVDERADPASPLRLGHHVVHERRLAGRLWPVDLDDTPAGQPADAQRDVERERAGGDSADRNLRAIAHTHHRSLAELALDLAERNVQRLLAIHAASSIVISLLLACASRESRIAPLTGAGVKGKQPPRTERRARSSAVAAPDEGVPGSGAR